MQRLYAAKHAPKSNDGLEFRPERWLDPQTGAFDVTRVWNKPFGAGPRMCYGYKMAVRPFFLDRVLLRHPSC